MPFFVAMIFTEAFQQSWSETANPNSDTWGVQWITDHATVMKAANKPAILEEFGLTGTRNTTYADWYSAVRSQRLSQRSIF
jgi:mannan endo-1,4-beta-mannosidase